MKKILGALFAFVFSGFAQAQDALVVTTCGTLPQAYSAGSSRLMTVDVNGKLCLSTTGGVASVANSDGTLTISPTTGAVVASINLAHANVWTAMQTITPASGPSLSLGTPFTVASFDAPGWQAPFATFGYNGATGTAPNSFIFNSAGNNSTNLTFLVSGGTLTSPTNAWSGGTFAINSGGWVGGAIAAYRTFAIIEMGGGVPQNPVTNGDIQGKIQLGAIVNGVLANRPGFVVQYDSALITQGIPFRHFNLGYQYVYSGLASDAEFLNGSWSGNVYSFGPAAQGTGVLRSMNLTGASVGFPAGTVSAPSINLGDAGTGIYRTALNQIAITNNGTQSALFAANQLTLQTHLVLTNVAGGIANGAGNAASSTFDLGYNFNGLIFDKTKSLAWGPNSNNIQSPDTYISRGGIATTNLGLLTGSGAATAQTLTVQGSSGNSAAAALFTIAGSDQIGTTTTGGGVKIRGGNGTSAGGTVEIWTSATTTPAVAASFAADKTAAFAGNIIGTITTDAVASSGSGALQIVGGASIAKRFWIPAITASAGLQTAVLCQSSSGEMIADSVACLASSERAKEDIQLSDMGLNVVMALKPVTYRYRLTGNDRFDSAPNQRAIHAGFSAEQAALIDSRLVAYDADGNVRTIRPDAVPAALVLAVQELKADNDNLRAELQSMKRDAR